MLNHNKCMHIYMCIILIFQICNYCKKIMLNHNKKYWYVHNTHLKNRQFHCKQISSVINFCKIHNGDQICDQIYNFNQIINFWSNVQTITQNHFTCSWTKVIILLFCRKFYVFKYIFVKYCTTHEKFIISLLWVLVPS